MLCQVLRVSRSGYYAWCCRGPSRRVQDDAVLLDQIKQLHLRWRERLGAVKTWCWLNQQGVACGKHRVTRLRQQNHLWARRRRRWVATTQSKYSHPCAPNRLQRDFTAASPDRVWVGDVTFVPTREGWLYLAIQIDLYSRAVVGWAMSPRNDTRLVLSALDMAVAHRQPEPGLIAHSDQGQPYASRDYRARIKQYEMLQSMSRKGDCWDNAVAESFFASIEFELIDQRAFASRSEAKRKLFEYIEVFYNRQRPHQTLEYQTPTKVDERYRLVA